MVFLAFDMFHVTLNVHLQERIEKIIYCQIFKKFISEVETTLATVLLPTQNIFKQVEIFF